MMQFELLHQPDSAIAKVSMPANSELFAEAGSMVAMNGHIIPSTTLIQGGGGGLLAGLKRMVAGESFFMSTFRTSGSPGVIFLAPKLMGDILHYEMTGTELVVQSTGYLAGEPSVSMDLGFQGFKSVFSGESIFWLTLNGHGSVLLSSFGGIYEIPVNGEYVVDTGHIVAFEKTLSFSITKAGSSWIGAFLGGEGLVCRFRGKGRLFCQTHNPGSFGQLIGGQLPPRPN